MTENHKFQQKGVGALRGGRDENDDDKVLTSSHRNNGGSIPPLPPYNNIQQTLVEQHLQLEQMGLRGQQSLLSPMWQEPADVKEKNAAATEPSSEKKEPTSKNPANIINIPPIFDPSVVSEQEQYNDFCLYQNNMNNFHLIAPLTPESLSNSPSMPNEPRMALLESFDSDEEKEYDTNGFFPSYSAIERRPF